MFVNNAVLKVSTPKGEYFSNGKTHYNSNEAVLFTCPDTVDGKKTMTLKCDFSDVNRWLDEPARNGNLVHYINANLHVDTHIPNQVLGRKGVSFLWTFGVGSNGICHGVAVDPTYQNSSFSNTVYYNLVD